LIDEVRYESTIWGMHRCFIPSWLTRSAVVAIAASRTQAKLT